MRAYYLGTIFDYLESDASVSEDEIAQLEWTYFQALRFSQHAPRNLHRALARRPTFFVDLIKALYLPDTGVGEPPPPDPDKAQRIAGHAWQILHDWATVPGSDNSGTIDGSVLDAWVKEARKLLFEAGRANFGDMQIGNILSAAARRNDALWPPEPVRDVIDTVRSKPLETGFQTGVYNRRGVTWRTPTDGGDQERALAVQYREHAESLRFDWPRTSACLARIADSYEEDAKRADERAEQMDWH
jgi:hypothetical protein